MTTPVRRGNGPTTSNTGEGNGEVRCALERVVLCVESRVRPFAVREFGVGHAEVVAKHPQPVQQIVAAWQ